MSAIAINPEAPNTGVKDVDAVVMWVDGSDSTFIEAETKAVAEEVAKGRKIKVHAARHRDNGELRYTLRAILGNLPWIRRVYVVTNGQVPSWLRFDGERVVHVKHADIFPDPALLPCFNSFVIESFLHRIKGLSSTFIRFSDDFFVGRPASREDVLGASGHGRFIFSGRVQKEPEKLYQQQITNNAKIFRRVIGSRARINFAHVPQPRNIAIFEKFEEAFAKYFDATRKHRFRSADDIVPLFLYPYFHLSQLNPEALEQLGQKIASEDCIIQSSALTRWYCQVIVGGEAVDWCERLAQIRRKPPLYFNLNDAFKRDSRDAELAEMLAFLEAMYPTPTPYEKDR